MSETAREKARWRKEKSPVIHQYTVDHARMLSKIAGRGFLLLPGYAYSLENELETTAKFMLSEINYKILSESIERELKQLGIDYDLAYKNAVIVWEIEKQGLLAGWDAELAGIKKGMAAEEEAKDRLMIAVAERAAALLTSRTALEIEAEGYRRSLVDLDDDTAQYEVILAQAKLLTAEKKLELIPYLEEIIAKEAELLVLEQQKAVGYTDYIEAERNLANKKETLIVPINNLASAIIAHRNKIINIQIPLEKNIANEKLLQAQAAVNKMGYQKQEMDAQINAADAGLGLFDAKRELTEKKVNNNIEILNTETNHIIEIMTCKERSNQELLNVLRTYWEAVLHNKETVHDANIETKGSSEGKRAVTRAHYTSRKNDNINNTNEEVAEIEATSNITAKLVHLIG